MKKIVVAALTALLAGAVLTGCGKKEDEKVVYVYNWGEYIDPQVLEDFESETGIKVVYDEFETNEIMFPKIASGAGNYDVVCPSDYMIQRLIQNDLLEPLNPDNIPNLKHIGASYLEKATVFDPGNKYSVPYQWGTVGILYNSTMVEEPVDSWNILWDESYQDNILMQDSVRDAFAVALKKNGHSLNSTDQSELEQAAADLTAQKPLVQAYVIDQVRDKMVGNEAALGVIYSGEATYCTKQNEDLRYVVPKEGSNVWIDGWVIPKSSKNKANAEAFINYMCDPKVALKNFEYITYSTPNEGAKALIEDQEILHNPAMFPPQDVLDRCEAFTYMGVEADELYNELWNSVKSN